MRRDVGGPLIFHLNAVVSTFDVRARSRRIKRHAMGARQSTPSTQPSCVDHNASCVRPSAMALRFSKHGCARCARSQLPCRSPNAAATARTPIRWLHIPKCGATLAVSVLSYACSNSLPDWHIAGMAIKGGRIDVRMAHALDARRARSGARCDGRLLLPFAGHEPVSARDLSRGGLVAFFRRPAQRLISAYLDNRHAWGLRASERSSLKSAAPTIAAFARYPGIAGCATKMLAGFDCAANVSLRDGTVLQRALTRLRSNAFAFIGIVEEWEASVCLLHRTLPGYSQPLIAAFRHLGHSVNSHRDIPWLPPSARDGEYNESVLEGFVDAADERVYQEARRLFAARRGSRRG